MKAQEIDKEHQNVEENSCQPRILKLTEASLINENKYIFKQRLRMQEKIRGKGS